MSNSQLIQSRQQLTYAAAAIAVAAAVAKSREIAAPECIAIVDAIGNLLAFARVEGAAVLARDPAIAKAATSASLKAPTGGIPFEFGANLGSASLTAALSISAEVFLSFFNGELLGAIGVGSGATEQDIAVAEAGRDAVLAALAGA